MIKGLHHVRTPDGRLEPVTATKLDALVRLAACPNGATGVGDLISGGTLAALVQFGLAERMPPDQLGGCRYRINAYGREFLADLERPQ